MLIKCVGWYELLIGNPQHAVCYVNATDTDHTMAGCRLGIYVYTCTDSIGLLTNTILSGHFYGICMCMIVNVKDMVVHSKGIWYTCAGLGFDLVLECTTVLGWQ